MELCSGTSMGTSRVIVQDRSAIFIPKYEFGRLAVYDGDSGEALAICGNPKAQAGYPVALLRVHDEKFWFQLVLLADMVCQLLYISMFGTLRQSCPIATQLWKGIENT